MSPFPWPRCVNRHDLSDPNNVYIWAGGTKRRCRICHNESLARGRANRIHTTPKVTKRGRPKQFKKWAENEWENMTEHDRMLIRAWANGEQ